MKIGQRKEEKGRRRKEKWYRHPQRIKCTFPSCAALTELIARRARRIILENKGI